MQATGRASFNAGGLQSLANAVGTKRALIDFFRGGIEFRHVEGTAGGAELATDAVLLLEIDDAIFVLNDGAIGGARGQTARIGAVHALVLAHQPLEGTIFVA